MGFGLIIGFIEYLRNIIESNYSTVASLHTLLWGSALRIATVYGLDDQGVGVQVPVGVRLLSSSHHPDRLWGPPSLLSKGYWEFFLPG
jgi:hypothetical protein